MAISLTCPGCATGLSVPDTLAGKRIKCKSCGTPVEVTATARPVGVTPAKVAGRPVRAAVIADDDDSDDTPLPARRPAKAVAEKGGSKLPLILAAVGAFVVVGGGLGGYLALSGGKDTEVAVAPADSTVRTVTAPAKPADEPLPAPQSDKPAAEKPPAKTEVAAPGTKPADPPSTKGSGLVAPLSPTAVAKPTAAPVAAPTKSDMDQLTIDKAKSAAVLIRCDTENGGGHGSGWFGPEPNLIFTNAHVIHMINPGSKKPKKLTVWVNPGTDKQAEIPHNKLEILAVDRSMDLAILKVLNVPDLPPPFRVRPSAGLRDLENLVVFGYPGGNRLAERNKSTKPAKVTVAKAQMQTLRNDDFNNVYSVQIQSNIVHGNSGGPICDVDGNVVAVAVRVDLDRQGRFTGIAYGVPTEYVTGLLAGRIGEVEYGQAFKVGKEVHIPVTVTCLDPFDRISKVGFGCWLGERTGKPRPPGTARTGEETGDTDFKEVELTYKPTKDKKVATGELVLPEAAADRAYWAQPFYSNSATPKYWMAGNPVRMLGVPVDRTAVDLSAVVKPGTVRTLTLLNKNSVIEFEEGEGADREERLLLNTQVSGREAMLSAPKGTDFGAMLRMRFEKVALSAEVGPVKIDNVLPKDIRKAFAEGIKLCEGTAMVAKTGEVVRTQADVRRLPGGEANQRLYKDIIIDPVMDSLMAASVRLPNKKVEPGETWKQTKLNRLAIQFIQDPRVAGPGSKKDDKDDDDNGVQRPGQPPKTAKVKGVREYKYQEEITYKYVGTRTRQGLKEAVLEVTGTIAPAPGQSEGNGASGKVKGYACLDLDTGVVVECEVDREFEVDTSAEGVKRRLSGVNTYKVTRGTPTAGSA